MSYYQQGLAIEKSRRLVSYHNGMVVGGPLVATPGAISDEIDEINAEVTGLDREIFSQLGSDSTAPIFVWYHNNWDPFLKDWYAFRANHSHWYSNLWGSAWTHAQDFRQRLVALHKSALTNGIQIRGPSPTPPKSDEGFMEIFKSMWSLIKVIVWGVLIIVVGGIIVRIVRV